MQFKNKCFFIDKQGNHLFNKNFDFNFDFHEERARIEINREWGFINSKGDYLVYPRYFDVGDY